MFSWQLSIIFILIMIFIIIDNQYFHFLEQFFNIPHKN